MLDLVFVGGEVIDGTGRPGIRADLGVRDGRIAAIGDLSGAECRERVDARGKVVCPGFIDMHTHSDLTLLVNPRAESMVRQGVTTLVVGNCGMGVAPVRPELRGPLRQAFAFLTGDVEWTWESFASYLDCLAAARPSVNVGALVSHGAVRAHVMGFDEREALPEERSAIAAEIRQAMAEGALGVSTGLIYNPSMFADTEELVAVSRAAAEGNGVYTTHMRHEGVQLMEAVEEALEVARRSGARTEICHLKASGKAAWGRAAEAAERIRQAREEGNDIAFDLYPYTAGSTMLSTLLPQWALRGTTDEIVARLRDPAAIARLLHELRHGGSGYHSGLGAPPYEWERVLITSVGSEMNRGFEGKEMPEVARMMGATPEEAFLRLLVDDHLQVNMVIHSQCEEDMRGLLKHPLALVITDGLAFAPYGPLGRGRPHPRSYGTFRRFLGRYVRDEGLHSLEEGIRRVTSGPAARMGITDRGILREGLAADIVVFDPAAIRDTATYTEPHQYPEGIDLVVVNGEIVVRDGEHTGAGPGQVLRKK